MYDYRRPARCFDRLGHVDGIDRIASVSQADFRRYRHVLAGPHHPGHNLADLVRITQQIRAALGLFGHVAGWTAKVYIHHADPKFMGQAASDLGQRRPVVIPNLHGQRPRFVGNAPKPIGQIIPGVNVQKASRPDHLRDRKTHPAQPPHDLAKSIVSKPSHRRR